MGSSDIELLVDGSTFMEGIGSWSVLNNHVVNDSVNDLDEDTHLPVENHTIFSVRFLALEPRISWESYI